MLFPTRLYRDLWIPEELQCRKTDSTLLNMDCFPCTSWELCFVSFLMQAEAPVGQLLHRHSSARRGGLTALWPSRVFNHDPVEFIPQG